MPRAGTTAHTLMKTTLRLGLVGICGGLSSFALAQEARPEADPSSAAAVAAAAEAAPAKERTSSAAGATAASITMAEALQKIAAAPPRYPAHPPTTEEGERPAAKAVTSPAAAAPKFVMSTPPPPPRAETKPPAPGKDYVWVPGHYMPIEGKWRWVNGEWSVPATPTSVWIQAVYDAETKNWNPGYWQPDRPPANEPPPPAKGEGAAGTAKPNGY
jgi:hypothetical protein